jgi:DNA-binding transcriptional MerR regulator
MDYPKKLYYSISEVAEITGVKAHVLRYWESEFPSLHPKKTRAGSRRYRQAEIESILAIKDLLYVKGFKIAGARKALRQEQRGEPVVVALPAVPSQIDLHFEGLESHEQLSVVRDELEAILHLVRQLGPAKPAPLKEMEGRG